MDDLSKLFEDALREIQAAQRIIIHRHSRPDGDAYGSQLGLYLLVKANFPDKEVYMVGDSNERLAFMLGGRTMDDIPSSSYTDALAVIMDTSAAALVSDDRWSLAKRTLRFDHHLFLGRMSDIEVVDPSFESCCGILAAFAKESGLEVPNDAASAIFTGMVTDSGRFRYDAVNARTFELAAFLMQSNIDTSFIYRNLYTEELSFVKLRARFALRVKTTAHNVAYTYTTRKELLEDGIDAITATRAFVNVMGDIKGVDIWAAFAESDDGIACELRAANCNINPIAVKYGGGGHAKASGATVNTHSLAMDMLKDLDDMAAGAVVEGTGKQSRDNNAREAK